MRNNCYLQCWTLIICNFTISTGFLTTSKVGGSFIYINHKPIDFSIDFSYRLKTYDLRSYGHWLGTSKSANMNLVPSPNTKNHLLSLS